MSVKNDDFLSIVFVHYSMNENRGILSKKSLDSLLATTKNFPCEIIVADNGGSLEDSKYFLELCDKGIINHYIRNSQNLHFSYARNQAIETSEGKYIAVVDNDLFYEDGWIEKCVQALRETEGKRLLATPLWVIPPHRKFSWVKKVEGKEYLVNTFAGSNCWMMHRKDWKRIGKFKQHIIAGTLWCREYAEKKYAVIVVTEDANKGIVHDQGQGCTPNAGYQKRGYENGIDIGYKRWWKKLSNGQKVLIC